MTDKKTLRETLRAKRQALSTDARQSAANAICQTLSQHPVFATATHIAAFYPNDGEIDPRPFLDYALEAGKQCYLPVLRGQQLQFAPYTFDTVFIPNQYQIPEPQVSEADILPAEKMSLIIVPVVGFDKVGHRLGMGGGFYDRTLSQISDSTSAIGIAFALQEVSNIPSETWDIPLSQIITEKGVHQC